MPRRRPSALRSERLARTVRRRRYPSIDRLSGSCTADLRRLERSRFLPEETEEAFWHWKSLAHGPLRLIADPVTAQRCGIPGCCDISSFRDHLEAVLHALPKKSARELRALVEALDDKILRRVRAIQVDNLGEPWWRDQL
ncbi:hypothetical protein JCM4814A_50190 [Streptomyces phaeofaciens JCM 4814]|uniref:Uncharacterized protein n=1 Tax=Streptomyces phaeofaciens TaxID=68254 RepID=A0A918H4S2_9ACTN|nr:hypothetical protein [Streptomyces phaeofaciens]GGT33171.1 hypothetical protein GCM10010226_06850 [Streptomyces phaeofaciens]